jgi:hypothetical protein
MKKLFTTLVILLVLLQMGFSQVYLEQFNPMNAGASTGSNGMPPVYPNVVTGGEWVVTGAGTNGAYDVFTYSVPTTVNATGNNKVYVRAKSSIAGAQLRMDIQDLAGFVTNANPPFNALTTSYQVYEFDFTGRFTQWYGNINPIGMMPCSSSNPCPVNGSMTKQLYFTVNQGTPNFAGTITIDYISFGTSPTPVVPGVTYSEHFPSAAAANSVVYTPSGLTSAWSNSSEIIISGNGTSGQYSPFVIQMRDATGTPLTNVDATLSTVGLMPHKVYVRARCTSGNTVLRLDLKDNLDFATTSPGVTQTVGTNYTDLVFDFSSSGYIDGGYGGTACTSGPCPVNATRLKELLIYPKPGVGSFSGDLIIDYISFGKPQTPTTYAALVPTFNKTNVTCFGGSNGTITSAVTGGSGNYTYNWGGGITSPNRTGLSAGTYNVTVTDGVANATATQTITLTQGVEIVPSGNAYDVACNGGATGYIILNASGGAGGFTYNWGGGITGNIRYNLAIGNYTATVSDANNCTATITRTVGQPAALVATASSTSAGCAGSTDGTINMSIAGGVSPYVVAWDDNGLGQYRTNLAAGTYSATITDANNCTTTLSSTVNQNTTVVASGVSTNVTCNGGSNGSITLTFSGTPSFTFDWGGGITLQNQTNLPAGTYTVTLTDGGGCTAIVTKTITQPNAIVANSVVVNPICNGTTGNITLSATGGTGAFTYNWGGGITSATRTGLAVGTYIATVTDANGCTKTISSTILPAVVLAASATNTNVSCAGGANGTINLTVNTGTAPYSYNWGGGITSQDRTGLSAGTYTCTVTDFNGCTTVVTTTVTQNAALIAAATPSNVACFGGATGSISLAAAGGIAPYAYNWGGGITSQTRTGLVAGTYAATITDVNGCTATTNSTVSQPTSAITGSAFATNANCFGAATGSMTLISNGGTLPYTYNWGGGIAVQVRNNLAAGVYTATIIDGNGCTTAVSGTVTQPTFPVSATGLSNPATCGGSTGNITLSAQGGTAPYTYNWGGGITGATRTGLAAGLYTATVSDANGCTDVATTLVNQLGSNVSAIATESNIACFGGTGSITLSGNGGTAPYTYNWGGGITSQTRTGLSVGTYQATVTDVNGCIGTTSSAITQPTVLLSNATSTNITCNGANNGLASVAASGGTAPYQYAWSNSAAVPNVGSLANGTYSVVVTDANGCESTTSVTITQPTVLSSTIEATPQSAPSSIDGSVSTTVMGGTAPYTYSWNNGGTTATISGLAPNDYSVVITDANGCSTSQSVTVRSFACALTASVSVGNSTCFGANNGFAEVILVGAAEPVTYNWSNGGFTRIVSMLAPNTYTISVVDANGCPSTLSATIGEPTQFFANATATPESAPGLNDGSAAAAPTGGTGTFFLYNWSNGATTSSISGLTPGFYTVTVSDANGCTKSQTVDASVFTCAVSALIETGNSTCNGLNNGFCAITLTNAVEPVVYNWSNGGFTRIVSMLAPGTYSVTMTDANGCPATISATIGEPAPFLANASATPVSAPGVNDGTATTNPVSSVGTFFSYAWSTGAITQSIAGLSPGNYSVTVVDPNGCNAVQTVVVGNACAVVASATAQNITCHGLTNGKITASLANGTAPYTYNWSNGQTTAIATGLSAGLYSVTIKDANGCESNANATLIEPSTLTGALSGITNVQCPGDPTGIATYTAAGGTSPYTYSWSNGSTSQTVANLLPGAFSVVATDASGCTKSANGNISVSDTQIPTLTCPANIRRCAGNNVVNYQLPIAADNCNILGGTFGFPSGLSSGSTFPTGVTTQTYTFTDASGNVGSCSFDVTIGTPVSYVGASIVDALGTQNNGSIDLTVSGGFTPYTYIWKKNGTVIPANTQDLTNIGAGTYSVVITDAIGCSTTSTDIIVDAIIGTSTPTWASSMKMVPNPTSGAVQLRFASMPKEEVLVTILDATGRVVTNVVSKHETVIQLDLTALPAGVYAVRMLSAGEVGVRSLVIE